MKIRDMNSPGRVLRTLGHCCGAGVLALLGAGAQAQLVNYGEQLGAYKDMAGSGKSVCNGACATNWPPLTATAAPGGEGYSLVTRDDGAKQVAYKGKPLYYWSKDMKPGDKTGDGVNNLWRTATP